MNPRIIKAGFKDLPLLEEIGKRTFYETFAASNTIEDMQKYLDTSFGPGKLESEWNVKNSLFFLVYAYNEPAGYMKLNRLDAQTEDFDHNWIEVERFYVLKQYQQIGIGKAMMEFCLKYAVNHNMQTIWLGVWENNEKAIDFYSKSGFSMFGQHDFYVGNDRQTDILMKRRITKNRY